MDLNLNLGPPLCPPPLSVDLGYDLALRDLPFSTSELNDALLPSTDELPPFDENPDPFDLPLFPPIPSDSTLRSLAHSASLFFDDEAFAGAAGEPAVRREVVDSPELRFQRLFESSHRWDMARTRSSREESASVVGENPATDPERLMRDIRRSGRMVGLVGKHKAGEVEMAADEKKEKDDGGSAFDCNICFEVAKEPVVTCCGHLFCWPCLYLWLHVHCDYKECPVCKGKVNESSVVPIYARGGSEDISGRKNAEDAHPGLKIPQRPPASRVESLRQQLQGPGLFRRSELWIHEMQELLRERFLDREGLRRYPSPAIASVPQLNETAAAAPSRRQIPQASTVPPAVSSEVRTSNRRREPPVLITLSDDATEPAPSPSQASTSSTMAVIQGDGDALLSSVVDLTTGGTSMVLRRRARTRSSAAAANDRGSQLRQRRRLN